MIKTQGISVEITGDYTKLQKALAGARSEVNKQSKGISDALNNAISPTQVSNSINKIVANFGTLNRAANVSKGAFDKINADLGTFAKQTGLTSAQLQKLQTRLLKTSAANAQTRALTNIGRSAGLTKREVQQLGKQFGLTTTQIAKVNQRLGNIPGKFDKVNKSAAILNRTFIGLFATLGGAMGLGALSRVSDEYTNINSKLKLVTANTEEFNSVYGELFRISQETGSSFTTNAKNFSNLALALKDTNVASSELLSVFADVNKSLVVAGASTAEVNSFLLQFKQALGANRLQGDEFRGMMESNSYWAIQFAKALGTDVKGLYEMKEAGLLTTQTVLNAHKKMSESIAADFGGLQKTIGRATQEMRNAWEAVFADADQATGASNNVADSISNLATIITENKPAISSAFAAIVTGAGTAVKAIAPLVDLIKSLSWRMAALSVGDWDNAFARFEKLQAIMGEGVDVAGEYIDKLADVQNQINHLEIRQDQYGLSEENKKVLAALRQQKEQLEMMIRLKQREAKETENVKKKHEEIPQAIEKQVPAIKKVGNAWDEVLNPVEDKIDSQLGKFFNGLDDIEEKLHKVNQNKIEVGVDNALTDFFAELDEVEGKTKDATTASTKLWEDFASNTGNIIEGFVGTTLRGQFDSISDMFKGLLDSMLDMLINFIARAAANDLIGAIFGKSVLGENALSLGTLIGGIGSGSIGQGLGKIGGMLGIGAGSKALAFNAPGMAAEAAGVASSGAAGLTGTSYATFQAPASTAAASSTAASSSGIMGSLGAIAGPAAFAAIAGGVVLGIANHFTQNKPSVVEQLNASGFGTSLSSAIGETLAPIPEAMMSGSAAFRNFRDAAYDVETGTLVMTSSVGGINESLRSTAVQIDKNTGEWVSLRSELKSAEYHLRQIAETQGYVTEKQVENVAAMRGVAGAADALKSMFGVLESSTEQLAGSASTTAYRVGAAASYMRSAVGGIMGRANDSDNDDSPGFAAGGYHSGGWRWVGENGPELEFTGPSRILSSNDSMKMVKEALGNVSGATEIHIHHQTVLDGKVVDSRVDKHIVSRNKSGIDPLQRAVV